MSRECTPIWRPSVRHITCASREGKRVSCAVSALSSIKRSLAAITGTESTVPLLLSFIQLTKNWVNNWLTFDWSFTQIRKIKAKPVPNRVQEALQRQVSSHCHPLPVRVHCHQRRDHPVDHEWVRYNLSVLRLQFKSRTRNRTMSPKFLSRHHNPLQFQDQDLHLNPVHSQFLDHNPNPHNAISRRRPLKLNLQFPEDQNHPHLSPNQYTNHSQSFLALNPNPRERFLNQFRDHSAKHSPDPNLDRFLSQDQGLCLNQGLCHSPDPHLFLDLYLSRDQHQCRDLYPNHQESCRPLQFPVQFLSQDQLQFLDQLVRHPLPVSKDHFHRHLHPNPNHL